MPALRYKPARIVPLVRSHREPIRTRQLLQHHQRRIALRRTVGLKDLRVHHQSIAVFRQQIRIEAQLRLLAIALPRQHGIGIGGGLVSLVAALLSVEIYAGVTGIVGRILLLILALKALQAGTGFQQRAVHSEVFVARQVLLPHLVENNANSGQKDTLVASRRFSQSSYTMEASSLGSRGFAARFTRACRG